MVFPILKCNIRYMNFLEIQQYLRNFISLGEKVALVSFFQNKFYNAVFIIRFFMNLQRQNVTNVNSNIRYKLFRRKFLKLLHSNHWTLWLNLRNCTIFSKLTVKYSLQNNSLNITASLYKVCTFIFSVIDIWWNSDCTL